MKYNVFVDSELKGVFNSFEEAIDWLEKVDPEMKIEYELKPIAYSPITFKEAKFYCNNVNEEMSLLNQVHRYARTPEEALKKLGLFPNF